MGLRINKLRFAEPRRNLPNYKGQTKETRLTYQFGRVYAAWLQAQDPSKSLAIAREIPANGYGIADLVVLTWSAQTMGYPISTLNFISLTRPRIRAFEVKLTNWRQGLLQANRYRNFADVAVLVIAAESIEPALKFIDTFRLLKVGLWSFNSETAVIVRHYTPRPRRANDQVQRRKVLTKVAKASRALQVF